MALPLLACTPSSMLTRTPPLGNCWKLVAPCGCRYSSSCCNFASILPPCALFVQFHQRPLLHPEPALHWRCGMTARAHQPQAPCRSVPCALHMSQRCDSWRAAYKSWSTSATWPRHEWRCWRVSGPRKTNIPPVCCLRNLTTGPSLNHVVLPLCVCVCVCVCLYVWRVRDCTALDWTGLH